MSRRRRILIRLAAALLVLVLGTSPVWGIALGQKISWLEVRRVELAGTRLLTHQEVLEASGVELGQHLLDEDAAWEQSLAAHPVIASARVTRRFPHTLRIRVVEKEPVALVADGTLRFATAGGELLPVDPFAVPMDLPIVRGSLADSSAAAATRRVLAEVHRLGGVDPGFLSDVSEIALATDDSTSLILLHRRAEVVVPFGVSARRIGELRRVIADVERRFPAAPGPEYPRHRIDLRFGDQVVVRPSTPPDRS